MTTDTRHLKRWLRWTGTFIGFPAAGVTARLVAGNIDDLGSAVLGGLAGGAVLGLAQVGIGGIGHHDRVRWIVATAVGLATGLTLGASVVHFQTDPASLAAIGALTGAVVGVAQALAIPMQRVDRAVWALATPALWAGGWVITAQVIVDTDRQHAVFGSSGALVVSALAGVLYALRKPPRRSALHAATSHGSAVSS